MTVESFMKPRREKTNTQSICHIISYLSPCECSLFAFNSVGHHHHRSIQPCFSSVSDFEILISPLHCYSILIRLGLQRDTALLCTCQRIGRPGPAVPAGHHGDLHLLPGIQTQDRRERGRVFNRMPAGLQLVRELGRVPDE